MSRKTVTVDGCAACAHVVHAVNEIITIYPITPSSPIAEICDSATDTFTQSVAVISDSPLVRVIQPLTDIAVKALGASGEGAAARFQ